MQITFTSNTTVMPKRYTVKTIEDTKALFTNMLMLNLVGCFVLAERSVISFYNGLSSFQHQQLVVVVDKKESIFETVDEAVNYMTQIFDNVEVKIHQESATVGLMTKD